MAPEQNPAQWPKFEHAGISYGTNCKKRIDALSIPVIFLQRWWRQRGKARKNQKIHPIPGIVRFGSLKSCVDFINNTYNDGLTFVAYEKLDGTNFGILCNGKTYGRRIRTLGDSYQKVSLPGNIPTAEQVRRIKKILLADKADEVQLMLYGELMCNPRKFKYLERLDGSKFFCFGAVVRYSNGTAPEEILETQKGIREGGYAAVLADNSGRIVLNRKLAKILEENENISCAPLMAEGTFREVCIGMEEEMMKDGMEGVVLTGNNGSLFKWKTSVEDESDTKSILSGIVSSGSPTILKCAGVDLQLLNCFIRVATPKEDHATARRGKAVKTPRKSKNMPSTMEAALISAMSKYDNLDSYFERDERTMIIELLVKEVGEDLNASTSEQIKCVESAVKKTVGAAFGRWKYSLGR